MSKKLFVGSLPFSFTQDKLKALFSEYGTITEAVIITDRMSGRSKGFGFVTFADDAEATSAVEAMNGKEVEGRKIVVNEARPMEERSSGGFSRGGSRGSFRGGRFGDR